MQTYASAVQVYRELRSALNPWCKAAAWRREPSSKAGWFKVLEDGARAVFIFSCTRWGSGDIGNSLTGDIRIDAIPSVNGGHRGGRVSHFTRCLVRAELDELAEIQTAVNARRPPAPEFLWEHAAKDPPFERRLRALYDAVRTPYAEGAYVSLEYYSLEDVRRFATFIAAHVPKVLERFIANRCSPPVFEPSPPNPSSGAAA
jgi:hypothetical protein